MATINLFFLSKGHYRCVVTTKEKIATPYDRKITVELEGSRKWRTGTIIGNMGSMAASEDSISKMTDDRFFYIDCRKWMYNNPQEMYLVIGKEIADGKEYETRDLQETLNGSSCNVFLFPA